MKWYLSTLLTLLAGTTLAAETWPLWDGTESVAEYAKRVNLPPTKALNLGNGAKLDLVLIPAGKFVMGTPEPVLVDEDAFHKKIVTGQALLAASAGVLLVMLAVVLIRAIRQRQRPKLSLVRLLAMTAVAGIAVLSTMHWQESARELERAKIEHSAAKARFDSSNWEEKPAHPVTLTRTFYMGKFTVTQEQYEAVVGQNPSYFKGKDKPVENVSWDEAQVFCKKLSERSNEMVRLPTEAEWEYACRAGSITAYYSGDEEADLARVAWYARNCQNSSHPVGQKEPNAFGLFDMHGNVWQWCLDWQPVNPNDNMQGILRSLRGGSWNLGPERCRSAGRRWFHPYIAYGFSGFRIVLEPTASK